MKFQISLILAVSVIAGLAVWRLDHRVAALEAVLDTAVVLGQSSAQSRFDLSPHSERDEVIIMPPYIEGISGHQVIPDDSDVVGAEETQGAATQAQYHTAHIGASWERINASLVTPAYQANDDSADQDKPKVTPYDIALAFVLMDLDRDGDHDLVSTEASGVHTWHNPGNGAFQRRHRITDAPVQGIQALDMNGDTRHDLLLVQHGKLSLWHQHSGGGFTLAQENIISVSPDRIHPVDMNSDGYTDILLSRRGRLELWLNDTRGFVYTSGQSAAYDERHGILAMVVSGQAYWVPDSVAYSEAPDTAVEFASLAIAPAKYLGERFRGRLDSHIRLWGKSIEGDVFWEVSDSHVTVSGLEAKKRQGGSLRWTSLAAVPAIDHALDYWVGADHKQQAVLACAATAERAYIHAWRGADISSSWHYNFEHPFNHFEAVRLGGGDVNNDGSLDVVAVYWTRGQIRGTTCWKQSQKN